MTRRRPKRLLLVALVAVAAIAAAWLWHFHRDYAAQFLARRGRLTDNRQQLIAATARTTTFDVWLHGDGGLEVDARMRVPNRDGKYAGVLLAVGLETGRRVIDLLEEHDNLVELAVDYGWQGEFDITSVPKFARTAGRMRTLSMEAVPRLLLALEFLARQPQVDTNRIVVVGVSYGSYLATPAAALEPRVSRLLLVQGGGTIREVTAATARRWRSPLPPRMTGWFCETVFTAFEPERWIGVVAPRKVTFIASRADPDFPVTAVERVYAAAGEPKELVWHDTPHVAPDAAEIIGELSRVVLQELGAESTTQ